MCTTLSFSLSFTVSFSLPLPLPRGYEWSSEYDASVPAGGIQYAWLQRKVTVTINTINSNLVLLNIVSFITHLYHALLNAVCLMTILFDTSLKN